MAGGFGSRFWPISRADKPKQFLDFTLEGKSCLRQTYDRMKDIVPDDNILVVSLSRYEELVKEQLPELKDENLLLEPYNRNTAPCLAFANYTILKRDPLAVTLVMPSDQIIGDHEEFNRILAEIKKELELHMPEITRLWAGWQDMLGTDKERGFLERIYTDMPRASIDYALMEKTENAWVYPAKFSWADIGNWDSLYEYLATHDENDNAISLKNKCLIQECKRNIIYSDKPNKLFAMRGIEDCIIIDTNDLPARRGQTEGIPLKPRNAGIRSIQIKVSTWTRNTHACCRTMSTTS